MASHGFHSPQFSEDTAWLPAWLQPHQLPAFGHGIKDENRFSQLCKSWAESPKHVPDVGDCYLSNKSDARFSNFRLHLSGDDSSAFENITSSEGLSLHLHLSSFGMSDYGTSTVQVKEQPQSSKKVTDNTNNQSKVEDKGPLSSTQAKNKLRFPSKKIKAFQKNQKSVQGKLLTTDISYAIELSIAASEAMVISDIVNSSLLSKNLPASSILEIAVRVERARKEFSLDVSDDDDFEVDDQISDLDETSMVDAFNDVGISLPQSTEISNSLSDSRKSPLDKFTYDSNTQVLESQFGNERKEENNKLRNKGDGAQACDVSLPGQILIQSSETLPVNYAKSCLKSQEKMDACNLQQIHNSLFPVQMEVKEGLEIPKALVDAKITPIGKAVTMKNIRELCNRESSFISESEEPEAIASSSTPHESVCKGTEGVVQETRGISSFDPLCSVVPCSISSDQPTHLDENITLPDKYGSTFNSIAEEERVLVEQSSDASALPKRRKRSSLRHYSVLDTNDLMKFTGNCIDLDGSNKSNIDERGLPVVFDNKRRRLSASKETLNNDIEGERVEKHSETMAINGKTVNCTKEKKPVKRVRFLEVKSSIETNKRNSKGTHCRSYKRANKSNSRSKYTQRKEKSTCGHTSGEKVMIFQGLEFLLTGFSSQTEKELEELIRSHGGYVLLNIPSNFQYARGKHQLTKLKLPIVISAKKVQSTKFLYGCATNTWILNSHWLYDSVQAGSLLPPMKFLTRPIQGIESNRVAISEPFCLSNHIFIFDRVGIILNGKVSFCIKFSKIIKHGGGKVFKSFESLVKSIKNGSITLGLVLVETEANVSRHLKHCALENNLQTVPANWVVNSLYSGALLPLKKDRCAPLHKIKMPTFSLPQDIDMSQEI